MSVTYFKRFRMEIDLNDAPPALALPEGFCWIGWDDTLVEQHAETTFECFRGEMDAGLFPSLGSRDGCRRLMSEIRGRPGFVPEATWMVATAYGVCGMVQGRRERSGWGGIQNLGILSAYRGSGLGTALLLRALQGFRRAGIGRAYLEVTAHNEAAIRLYRRLGFRCRKTLYKAMGESFALASV